MTDWTDQETSLCLETWERGLSYHLIATELGTKSRSAVAGFLLRRGKYRRFPLEAKKRVAVVAPRRRQPVTQRQRIMAAVVVFDMARPEAIFADLSDDGCKYAAGAAPPYTFCNQAQVDGMPYCAVHCRIAYAHQAKP